jgi:hypothetical protein
LASLEYLASIACGRSGGRKSSIVINFIQYKYFRKLGT